MANNGSREVELAAVVSNHVHLLVAEITRVVRESVSEDLIAHLTGSAGPSPMLIRVNGRRRLRDLSCIAPGCGNKSKGPRFHYLCEAHGDTPKRTYEEWRKQRHERDKQ